MISALVKSIMSACNLQQNDLAEVIGASLSRVKSITSGRVQKLYPQEIEALVTKLGISPRWLTTQQGPMFAQEVEDESDDEFEDRISRINYVRTLIEQLPLYGTDKDKLVAVMAGDPIADGRAIANALTGESKSVAGPAAPSQAEPKGYEHWGDWGSVEEVRKLIERHENGPEPEVIARLPGGAVILRTSARDCDLLANFWNSPDIGKEAIERTAQALAVSNAKRKKLS